MTVCQLPRTLPLLAAVGLRSAGHLLSTSYLLDLLLDYDFLGCTCRLLLLLGSGEVSLAFTMRLSSVVLI